jgi:hypothetical protein
MKLIFISIKTNLIHLNLDKKVSENFPSPTRIRKALKGRKNSQRNFGGKD